MDYNSISQSLVRAGLINTVDLGNSIVVRPAPHPSVLSSVPYSELNNWLDDNIPTGKEFIWYFTLALGFSPETTTPKYWLEKFTETINDLNNVKKLPNKKSYKINLAFNLEYHSDEITLHAHGLLWGNDEKSLKEFKRCLRKSFNIAPHNRCKRS